MHWQDVVENCSRVWRCDVPTKAVVFAWITLINGLPTGDLLAKRGIVGCDHETCCVLRFREDETINHLLCECIISQKVWESIFRWLDLPLFAAQDVNTRFTSFGQILKGRKLKMTKHIIWMHQFGQFSRQGTRYILKGSLQAKLQL